MDDESFCCRSERVVRHNILWMTKAFVAEVKEWFVTIYIMDYFTQEFAVDTVLETSFFSTNRREKRSSTALDAVPSDRIVKRAKEVKVSALHQSGFEECQYPLLSNASHPLV